MLKLLRYLDKRQRGQALLTLVFVVLQVRLDLTLPDYMATITSLAETPRLHHGPDPRPGRLHDAVRRRLARVQRHLRLPRLPRGGGPLAHPSREGLQPGARPLARGRRPLRRGVARQPLHERHNPDPEPRLDGPLGHRQGPCHGDLGRRENRRLRLGVDARDRRAGRAPHALLADGRLLELRHAGGPRVRAAQHDLRPAAARPGGRRARERGHRGRARRD